MSDWKPDLHRMDYLEDPVPVLERLRRDDPVHRSQHGYWFLTRYADVRSGLRDRRFSSDWSKRDSAKSVIEPRSDESDRDRANRALILSSFNMRDGEEHFRIRTLVNQAFSRSALEARRGEIESLADSLLPAAGRDSTIDLVTEFGFPLPILVASDIIGIPAAERQNFRKAFEDTELLSLPGRTAKQHATGLSALDWQIELIRRLVRDRKGGTGTDLISELSRAEEAGDRLTPDETIAAVVTIVTAAGTTTERFISSGLLTLLQHPEELRRLRAEKDLLPSAIEEILRFHHPNQSTSTPRWVTEDVRLRDKTLHRGDRVRFGIGAANRDPEFFPDPERFDVGRQPNRHLSFGRGSHFCVGEGLARLIGAVAFRAVLDRYAQVDLVTQRPRRDPRRPDRYQEVCVRVQ